MARNGDQTASSMIARPLHAFALRSDAIAASPALGVARPSPTPTLIDAESEAHVWADQFDTDRRDLAEAQSNITARLANGLYVALLRDASRRVAEQKRTDPDAQDLVMRGWSLRYRA
jgi:hypothetical protein